MQKNKKQITFKDSWLDDVIKVVKKYENYTPKFWSIMQKYDYLVAKKIIKPIK